MIHTPQHSKILWTEALRYLATVADMKKVNAHIYGAPSKPSTDITDIYQGMLSSLRNRQAMANAIGDIPRLAKLLHGFLPSKVVNAYGDDWKKLFRNIQTRVKPTSRMQITNPKCFWVHFCKGTLDAASYLNQFKNGREFIQYVQGFAKNPVAAPGLPMMIAEEIHGYGFPLACDFLKEMGFQQYGKPDVHVNFILKHLGLSDGTDYKSFKALVKIAGHVGETAYTVDKGLWLIGSGWLYLHEESFKTNKQEFVKSLRHKHPTLFE